MGAGHGLFDELVDALDDVVTHALKPVGGGHVEGNAGHDVLTVFALGVHHGDRIDHLHRGQVTEISRHGRGPHVDGQSVGVLDLSRAHTDNLFVVPDTDGYCPFALPQRIGKCTQGKNVGGQVLQAVLLLKPPAYAFEVGRRFLESGRIDFDVIQAYGRVVVDGDVASRLADDLFTGPGFLGHKNQHVTLDCGHTPQPKSLFLPIGVDELVFFLLPSAAVGLTGSDAVFFEMAFLHAHNAFSANFLFAAQRFDVHTQKP